MFPCPKVTEVQSRHESEGGRWDEPVEGVTQLIGSYLLLALPFPAHLRENRDLCTGSTGTKCFQIKIIFPYALLACFLLSLRLAGLQPVTAFPLLSLVSACLLILRRFLFVVNVLLFSFHTDWVACSKSLAPRTFWIWISLNYSMMKRCEIL